MEKKMVICLDAAYKKGLGAACGIVFANPYSSIPLASYSAFMKDVSDYVPGSFYLREMPLINKVLERVQEKLEMVFIDAYAWLPEGKAGLGVHLFHALDSAVPVIGMAKNQFRGHFSCEKVLRGKSIRPLYVTSVGISSDRAAKIVRRMSGRYRVPDMMRLADRKARSLVEDAITAGDMDNG